MTNKISWRARLAIAAVAAAVPAALVVPGAQAAPAPGGAWKTPTCDTVQSTGNFTMSRDFFRTVLPTSTPVPAMSYTNLTTTSMPNTLVGTNNKGVFASTDAGCVWRQISPATDADLDQLIPGAWGVVWGVGANRDFLYRISVYSGASKVKLPTADENVLALWPDPSRQGVLRVVMSGGGIFESTNSGFGWTKIGGFNGPAFSADIAPTNPNNVLIGTDDKGAFVSHDGGVTFQEVQGHDGDVAQVVKFSALDANIAWVKAHHNAYESQGNAAKRVAVSTDGGNSFRFVADGTQMYMTNQPTVVPDPRDANVLWLTFGMWFDDYGTDINRIDARTGVVEQHHLPFHDVKFAFHPSNPDIVYTAVENEPRG